MDIWETIAAARRDLAAQLDDLTARQWEHPSLCDAWTVRDVVAHLVVPLERYALARFAVAVIRARGDFDRANRALAARGAMQSPEILVADLRRRIDSHFSPPTFGPEAPLTDILVHGLDIRIPLGLPTAEPAEHFRPVLDLLVSPKATHGFIPRALPRVRFAATDLDWSHGTGEEVRASASDLTLAMSGRAAHVDALAGPGAAVLATWLPATSA